MKMTNNQALDETCKKGCCCSGISWSAIFAGAFVAIGLSFLLYAFGTAIGLSAFTVTSDNITTVAIGGFIAMLFGGIVAMFVSGWVAGYLNHCCCHAHCTGALAGFLSWCLALVITALLTVQLGQLLSINYNVGSQATPTSARFTPSVFGEMLPSNKSEHAASSKAGESRSAITDEKLISNVGKALVLTFLLFLFGALASTFGGHCAMRGCRKAEKKNRDV